jgi:hypothetical protein
MSGKFTRDGMGPCVNYGAPVQASAPVPAADADFEQSQPINRDDRRAMLRRHFAAGGMTNAQIEAALSKAKV